MGTDYNKGDWTEEDFTLHRVEDSIVDDPWAISPHSSVRHQDSAATTQSTNGAITKTSVDWRSGIFVPDTKLIQPFTKPTSRLRPEKSNPLVAKHQRKQSTLSTSGLTGDDIAKPVIRQRKSETANHETARGIEKPKQTLISDPEHSSKIPQSMLPRQTGSVFETLSQEESDSIVESALGTMELNDLTGQVWEEHKESDEFQDLDVDEWLAAYAIEDEYESDLLASYEEPEPTAQYIPDIRESLHHLKQDTSNLASNLEIDRWLATIEYLDASDIIEIKNLIQCVSTRRSYHLLRWMRTREWDALLLLQFFRFWSDFKSFREFWKRLQWSASRKRWYEIESNNDWTLDVQLRLLNRNTQNIYNGLIDYDWLSDWQAVDPWLRVRNQFFSFASFALYRSSLHEGEDWRFRPDHGVDFETPIHRYRYELSLPNFNPLHSTLNGSNDLANWFTYQDWYPRDEWEY